VSYKKTLVLSMARLAATAACGCAAALQYKDTREAAGKEQVVTKSVDQRLAAVTKCGMSSQ
jgi:hypothetical protein